MSEHNLISVDLAKNVFQLCAMTDRMSIVFNRQLKRKDLARFMATQNPVYPNIPRHISQGTHASSNFPDTRKGAHWADSTILDET